MPVLAAVLHWLPVVVIIWMVVGASLLFTRHAGRRDARGLGIALSIWCTLVATSVAITPPLSVQLIGTGVLFLSLALYQWAAISIRGRVFSYAGNDDLPRFVHRSGPYAYVRNPVYLSYLLAEIATVVMWPSVWGGVIVVLATVYFQWLARFEEGKFARSTVAGDYARYQASTCRLLPRLKRRG